ncbi:MAG: PIN domain-containing protein [Actinobacteria bacterium]|nr:PIN domain-containing protein [Actinomycetota bacterium]
MIFIDANIFIRYFVSDDSYKSKKVEELFQKIVNGEIESFTNQMVVAEIVWVLDRIYNMDRQLICDNIEFVLNTPNIKIKEKNILFKAIKTYRNTNVDFIDAYNYSYILIRHADSIFSYDSHFDKLESIKRIEP